MVAVDTGDNLIITLSELETREVIIVMDGFEPDHLAALEARFITHRFRQT